MINFVHYQITFLINSNASKLHQQSASKAKNLCIKVKIDLHGFTADKQTKDWSNQHFWHFRLIDKLIRKCALNSFTKFRICSVCLYIKFSAHLSTYQPMCFSPNAKIYKFSSAALRRTTSKQTHLAPDEFFFRNLNTINPIKIIL